MTLARRLEEIVYAEPAYGSQYFSPSDVDGCSVYMYHKLLRTEGTRYISFQSRKNMDRGIASEESLASYLGRLGVLRARQVHVYHDILPIHGKIDFLIQEDPDDVALKIIEHTTKGTFAFTKLKGAPANKVRQWNIYSGLSGIDHGYVTVDGGTELGYRWFPMEFDCGIFSHCMDKFAMVYDCFQRHVPPVSSPPYVFGSSYCLECPYFKACYPGD